MRAYESTTTIAARDAQAWAVLADVPAWPDWLPTVKQVAALDTRTLRVGARFRIEQPRLQPTIWTVTEVTPNRSFVWQSRRVGLEAKGIHLLEPISGNEVKAICRMEFSGTMSGLTALFFGRLTQAYVHEEGEALRRKTESLARR